jgi:hypothetical protein
MGTLEDGLDYLLKRDTQSWPGMAAEFFCCSVSQMIGIPVPHFCAARDTDGNLVFASQIFDNPSQTAASQAAAVHFLATAQPSNDMLAQISKLYSYDLFTNNTDRHINNFLFRLQNSVLRVLIVDFDRAVFFNWPLPDLPLDPSCNTVLWGRQIRQHWGFARPAALDVIMSIAKLPKANVEFIVGSIPTPWLSASLRNDFLTWWSDGRRFRRLRLLWKGIKDGTLL